MQAFQLEWQTAFISIVTTAVVDLPYWSAAVKLNNRAVESYTGYIPENPKSKTDDETGTKLSHAGT